MSQAEREHWRGISAFERRRFIMKEMLVPYPAMNRVIEEIGRSAKICPIDEKGAMLVVAGSGGGKTFLINYIKRLRPPDHSGYVSKVPTVSLKIPFSPSPRQMSLAVLRALELPKIPNSDASRLFELVVENLESVSTEILLIDDVQDIPERKGVGGIKEVGNWIRDLIDKTGCLVVLFGTPAAIQVTSGNAQLRKRISKQMNIRYFGFGSVESKRVFKRFLFELDKMLPLAERSMLDDSLLMHRIYYATYGIADYVFKLIAEAVGLAVGDGRERLECKDLARAFELVFQDAACGRNPFVNDDDMRPLNRPGEPFHNWFDSANPEFPE